MFSKAIVKNVPFVAVITLSILAQIKQYDVNAVKPFILLTASILVLNLFFVFAKRIQSYFVYGVSGISLIGCAGVFIFPALGSLYVNHIIAGLYLGLFVVAFFPPLFKLDPFTFEYSKKDYPEAVTAGKQFLHINLIINYMWALLFAVAFVLTSLTYHSSALVNSFIKSLLPIFIQLGIGLPLTIKLPSYFMQKVGGDQLHFSSVSDLFTSMPFGLNKKNAEGVNTVIQFNLSGQEATTGFLTIQDQICTYNAGEHSNPNTTILCDSNLWLQISNGYVSGDKAYMNGEYKVLGDASILLKFGQLFAPPTKSKKKSKNESAVSQRKEAFEYKSFAPGKIKSIIVFDGGPRGRKHSKTSFMVDNFLKGAEQSGASVEYIKLAKSSIKECTGCYSCWTIIPGECIHKDDMTELRQKYREADLVVFASPLYIFNVTGIMKTFMDRLLPTLKPYMLINAEGDIAHPDRFPEQGEQGFVVFSAAGFPEVDHNFDALKAMYRCWDSHSENSYLLGEFFLTAAEVIVHSVYAERKKAISNVCFEAGKQVVTQGKIDQELMLTLQDPGVSKEVFQAQADNFWESLEGKKSYLSSITKL